MINDVHVVVPTDRFGDDLTALLDQHGFRVDAIYPADSPSTAIVSAHGVRLRLESSATPMPVTLHLLSDDHTGSAVLPGGSTLEFRPFTTTYELPDVAASRWWSRTTTASAGWGAPACGTATSCPTGGADGSWHRTSRSPTVGWCPTTSTSTRCGSR